jgi:hypothetical protein
MMIVGVVLIAVAAAVELIASVLFAMRVLTPNPHMPLAMLSGVVFAVAGLVLYLAA